LFQPALPLFRLGTQRAELLLGEDEETVRLARLQVCLLTSLREKVEALAKNLLVELKPPLLDFGT